MEALDKLGSKITYENKTIIGAAGIILAIFFWILTPSIGFLGALISVLPAILLIIPNTTIKNSKVLAIITGIILAIWLLAGLSHFYELVVYYLPDTYLFPDGYVAGLFIADVLEIILVLYGLFCALLLSIQTEPENSLIKPANRTTTKNTGIKYDKYCSKCGQGLINNPTFCPSCGTKLKDS